MPKKKRRPRKPVRHHKPQSPRVQRSRTPILGDNVIGYAVHQGIDVTDPDALNRFMALYNALPHEERVAISDGDWREDAEDPDAAWLDDEWDDEVWPDEEWEDDDELDDMFPGFLGDLPDDDTLDAHIDSVDDNAYFVDAPLMRRADLLLRLIGDGHPFTDEGLGRESTVSLLEQFGYEPEDIATTWDAPPVSGLLVGLVGAGYVEFADGQVRPAAKVSAWAWPDAPSEARPAAGRVLHATTLHAFLGESELGPAAVAGPFTAMALMNACGPAGLSLPETSTDAGESERDSALRRLVRADLLALEDLGIVQRDGDVFTASPVLLTVLPAVLEEVTGGLPT